MTSQVFHLVMLVLVGAMSLVSWHGYRHEPWERKTALKWNAIAGLWFFYLVWNGTPDIVEEGAFRYGLAAFSFLLAVNIRRLLLGVEFLFTRHWAEHAISAALRSGAPIDAQTTSGLLESPPIAFTIPGLRSRLHLLRARHAHALREKVTADALLAEAIVRRERAREEAEVLISRRMAGPNAWRTAAGQRAGRH